MQGVRAGRVHLLLLFVFVFSGAAGLIYQSIWTQYLGLFLGHAAYAQSLVLILFMGGMGLGAWLVSRWSERVARPLMVYAIIEFALGLFGLTFDTMYRHTTEYAYAHLFTLGGPWLVATVRWGLASALILPQCILLGATFPLMSAGCLRYMPEAGGRVLSGLYFSNSIGAAAGALLATFALLPAVGLPGTLLTAALLNILVALLAWPIGKTALPGRTAETASGSAMAPLVVLAVAAVTGLTSFVYEVVWVRMLALVVGSTVHAFELMLAAFISGLAFGGLYLKSRSDRWQDTLRAVAWIQVLMGLAALLSLWLYANAFVWVGGLINALSLSDTSYGLFHFATAVICLLIMFPAAFFAGMTLPLLTLTLLRRGGERVIGQVYAANTLGCIVGVLLTVHLLLPYLGVKYALWIAAAADLLVGVALFLGAHNAAARRRDAVLAFAVTAVALAATAILVTFNPLNLASSVFRGGTASLSAGTKMLYYRDGKTATVALYESPGDSKRKQRSIATNGKVDAAANLEPAGVRTGDEHTMAMAGILPLAYLPQAKVAGVIGFGSGITAHTLLASRNLTRVDTIEIEPSMVDAARNFEALSARAYTDPRSHIVFDDAKAYFSSTKEKYDIIVSEPSNPWVSGVATLFTEEFYRFIPKHLGDDGIFVQWVQLYEITPELVSTVARALLPHFDDVEVYMPNSADMLIVAKPKGKLATPNASAFEDIKAAGGVFGIETAGDLRRYRLFGREGLAAFASMYGSNPNSDFFPVLQLNAPKARFQRAEATSLAALQSSPLPVLEAAGEFTPEPLSTSPPAGAGTRYAGLRFRQRDDARETRREMLGEHLEFPFDSPTTRIGVIAVVRDFAHRCESHEGSLVWFANAIAIANVTIASLGPEDLQGVWIDPSWARDCSAPSPFAADALMLFSSLAKRQWIVAQAYAQKLSKVPDIDKVPGAKRYLASVLLVCDYAIGNYEELATTAEQINAMPGGAAFYEQWLIARAKLKSAK